MNEDVDLERAREIKFVVAVVGRNNERQRARVVRARAQVICGTTTSAGNGRR